MNHMQVRDLWTQLRFEYYISGRSLFMDGLFSSGLIMLSYAIETGLKALISEYRDNTIQKAFNAVKNDHSIIKLHRFCKKHSIIGDIKVSNDFLEFISLNFNRYPSQIQKSNSVWFSKYSGMSCASEDLNYFDDFILQIDEEIFHNTKDIKSSLMIYALRNLQYKESRIFFQQNYHAHSQIPLVLKTIETQLEHDANRILQDIERIEKLRFSYSQPGVEMALEEVVALTKADRYKL